MYTILTTVSRQDSLPSDGTPSIAERLAALKDAGCDRILVAPLYPQYCAATTATVFDEVARVLAGMRWQPSLRFLPSYHDDPAYIAARSEEHTSELQSLMRNSYSVFCLKKTNNK